jgi:hypothetical protein
MRWLRKAYKMLLFKPERKGSLRRPWIRQEENIKMEAKRSKIGQFWIMWEM